MITLYENTFSPFARKVRMALEHKGLKFEAIDGLRVDNQAALANANPRREARSREMAIDCERGVMHFRKRPRGDARRFGRRL